jgi:hypothetical protein
MLARGRLIELNLDLGPIRRELGDKWERAAPSVRRFASLVIDRHLGDAGSFTLSGDVFIIRFAGIRASTASRRRMEMERDLHEMLFGSGETEELEFHGHRPRPARRQRSRRRSLRRWLTSLRRVIPSFRLRLFRNDAAASDASPEDAGQDGTPVHRVAVPPFEDTSSVDPAGAAQGTTVGESAAPGEPPVEPSKAPSSPQSRGIDRWRTNATPAAQSAGGRGENDPSSRPLHLGGGDQDVELEFVDSALPGAGDAENRERLTTASSRAKGRVRRNSTDVLERALYAAIEEARRQSERMRVRFFPPLGTRCLYRPMWLVERGMLPIYTCLPACALGPFEFVTGEALVPKGAGAKKTAALDEMVLDTVVHDLAPRPAAQMRSFVCLPVHFETLAGDRASAYFAALDRIPAPIRKRVIVEIVDISQGVGQLATYSLVRKLKGHVRSVIGRVDLTDMNFRVWRETDLSFIGIDIECENRSETELIADLNNFVVPAKQYGMQAYVRGVRTLSLAAVTVASGFDYVDGPAIGEGDFTLRTDPQPFGIYDVYN